MIFRVDRALLENGTRTTTKRHNRFSDVRRARTRPHQRIALASDEGENVRT